MNPEKLTDMGARELELDFDGKRYCVPFNNAAMRVAEQVYEDAFERPEADWTVILKDLLNGKFRAVQAVYFGALHAAHKEISWEEFDEKFSMGDVPAVAEVFAKASRPRCRSPRRRIRTKKNA